MSKIHSIKQQKKYRNQTMTILNHMNSKTTTPTLADKSLHSFKSIKPEVQSSRLNRPDTAKLYGKYGVNYYIGQNKDKDRRLLDISEKVQKISSKSLESRQGSVNTHRRQTEKTKKNSYSKLQTEQANGVQNQSWQMMMESMQSNLQKRLKHVEKLFTGRLDDNNCRKELNISQINSNYLHMKQPTRTKTQIEQKNPTQMIYELNKKFIDFQSLLDQRKNKMIFDEIDNLLQTIINSLRSSFIGIVDTLLKQNEQKMLDIEMSIQKIVSDHQDELAKQAKKCERIKQNYNYQIEALLVRSLYMNDKINAIQENGIFNFEEIARRIDAGDISEDQQEYQESCDHQRIQQSQGIKSQNDFMFEGYQIPAIYEKYPESSSSQRQSYKVQRINHSNLIQQANRANKHGYIQKLR